MDFSKVMETLATFFEEEGFPFAVIGAFGLHAYGLSRATHDVDLVTSADAQPRVVSFLESLGYETLHRSSGYSNHLHPDPSMGRVDLVYVSGETARRIFREAGGSLKLGGHSLPVPRAEYLAAMKIHAMKNDPSRSFRELADIQFILGLPGVDAREIRAYFEESGLLELYEDIEKKL